MLTGDDLPEDLFVRALVPVDNQGHTSTPRAAFESAVTLWTAVWLCVVLDACAPFFSSAPSAPSAENSTGTA